MFKIISTRLAIGLSILISVSACTLKDQTVQIGSSENESSLLETVPCWLNKHVSDNIVGQVGLSRDIYIGGEKPVVKSRRRALLSLSSYLGLKVDTSNIKEDDEKLETNGQTFNFAQDISKDGYVYSYVTLGEKPATLPSCLPETCRIDTCSPKWLCYPSSENEFAALGMSFQATSPVEQDIKSIENALIQAAYINGADIEAYKYLKLLNTGDANLSSLQETSSVQVDNAGSLSYLVTDRCFSGATLFNRVAFPKLMSNTEQVIFDQNDKAWLKNPKYKNFDGAIGAVERQTASGLLSDQIKLAVKRAAIQLAFEEQSEVSEELIVVQFKSGRQLLVENIKEQTSVSLSARIMSFHFDQTESGRLKVYVWLAKI